MGVKKAATKRERLEFAHIMTAVWAMEERVEEKLREELKGYIDAQRKGVVMRSQPCCAEFVKFDRTYYGPASNNTDIYQAKRDSFGGVALTFRGEFFNYCPFCGEKL